MKLKNRRSRALPVSEFSDHQIRQTATDICRILTAYRTLNLSEIQEMVDLKRDAILFSLGWLAGQGVIWLESSDDGFKATLRVHNN